MEKKMKTGLSYNPLFDTSPINSWKARINAVGKVALCIALTLLFLATSVTAAPFAKKIQFTQPDGTAIELWGQGDEFRAVFETLDGYTVTFDPAAKAYFYATLSADGSDLISSGLQVGKDNPNAIVPAKHLRKSPALAKKEAKERFDKWDQGTDNTKRWNALKAMRQKEKKAVAKNGVLAASPSDGTGIAADGIMMAPPSFTTTGSKTGLCLLIDFDDDPASIPQAEIVDYCNADSYSDYSNNGSVKKYFNEVSNNYLNYTNVVTAYVRMEKPKSYYNDTSKDCGSQGNELIKDAIAILKAKPNYATEILPTFSDIDTDGSGNILCTNVFYAGDNGNSWMYGLWPHSWALYNGNNPDPQELSAGGKKVFRYQITNIGSSLEISTFCHENGHMLCDFPDLYDYDYDSIGGAGDFCLMGSGAYGGNPVQVCAYLKLAAGWATTTELTSASKLTASLNSAGPNFNHFYRYVNPAASTEYFLIENRQQTGRDAVIPASGLAVWHIDELGDRDNQSMTPNSNHANYECTLVQADNLWHFETTVPFVNANYGDSKDLYYRGNTASAYTNILSDSSTPNAHWWNGTSSDMLMRNISVSGSSMTFDTTPIFTVTFVAGANGTITGAKVQEIIQGGDSSQVTAVPKAGCYFVNWTGTNGFVTTTTNPLTVSDVQGNMTITANFASSIQIATTTPTLTITEGSTATFGVKLTAGPGATKTVSISRTAGDTSVTVQNPNPAILTFDNTNWNEYQTVTLFAAEDANILNSTATITLSSSGSGTTNKTVAVTCTDNDTTLCIRASGKGTATVPAGTPVVTAGTYTVTKGSTISISTTAIAGYHLDSWTVGYGTPTPTFVNASGYPQTLTTTTDVTISGQATITPNFVLNTYSVNFAGTNGRINGTVNQTINHASSCTAVTAVPSAGFKFVNWTGTGGFVTTTANPLTVANVTSAKDITANFDPVKTSAFLTMAKSGSGIINNPVSGVKNTGVEIPISATANFGNTFVGWSVKGNAVLNTARTAVTLYDDATVTANFLSGTVESLTDGTTKLLPSALPEDMTVFTIDIPGLKGGNPVTSLNIVTSGGNITDDCDIYARFAAAPTLKDYYAKSTGPGTAEEINIINPSVGTWYIMVYGYNSYSGVSLDVTLGTDGPGEVTGLAVASPVKTDRVSLSWTAATGAATGYEVWRSDVNDVGLAELNSSSLTATSYNDIFTIPGEYRYYYWVRAVNGTVSGELSSPVYGTNTASGVIALTSGTAVTAITGNSGSVKTYSLTVPDALQTLLEVSISGGTGDCDIDVVKPDGTVLRRSVSGSNNELVQIQNPTIGKWLINLYGQTGYSGVTLLAKYGKTLAPLPPPAALAASDGLFEDRILLSWTATPGATSYLVYRGLLATATDLTYLDEVTDNTYEDINLDPVKTYFYFVKAKIGDVTSVFSAGNSGYLMKAPLAPAAVTASTGIYFDKILITWPKVADATSYRLYRSKNTENASTKAIIATIPYDSRLLSIYSYNDINDGLDTDPNLANTYNYWVEAVNGNGASPLKQSAATGSIKKTGPMSVTASKGTYFKNVKITWLAVPGATGYDVYESETASAPAKIGSVSGNTYEYYDIRLDEKIYYYWVAATFGDPLKYSSDLSTPAIGGNAKITAQTTLAAPVMKSVTNDGAFVRIAWVEVPLAASYSVYRKIGATDTWVLLTSTPLLTFNSPATTPGQTYMYCVQAVNGTTSSPLSSSMSAYAGRLAATAITYPTSSASFPGLLGSDGKYKFYQIAVPSGVSRLVAKAEKVTGSCDLYAKIGMYPTTTSYNAIGTAITGTANKILTVTNPAAGEWYILLYGSGTAGYNYANLSINYYTKTDIIFTQVPTNDLPVPFTATFKGKVQDIIGGLPGISLQVRNPITGIISWLPANTDTSGFFTYSTTINTEGEHTFDFFFTTMSDPAEGTASHTVATRKGCLEANNFFDFSAYLPATPIGLVTESTDYLAGMQTFLDIRNGWVDGAIDPDYEALWMKNTIAAASADAALRGKLDEGLYMFFYGVEGASVGNDIAAKSAFSAVPFVVHVDSSKLSAVVSSLNDLGIIDDAQRSAILTGGKIGVVAVAALSNPGEPAGDKNIYLLAREQLEVLANLADGDTLKVTYFGDQKYSDVVTKKFSVELTARPERINVLTSAFVK